MVCERIGDRKEKPRTPNPGPGSVVMSNRGKHTPRRRRAASALPFEQWNSEFAGNVRYNPKAKKAWSDIQQHGLSDGATLAFYMYALVRANAIPHPVLAGIKRAAEKIDAVDRAIRIAEERRQDPRAEMFSRRAADKAKRLASQPVAAPAPPWLPQVLAVHPELGEPLPMDRKIAAEVRRYRGKEYLLILRDYAEKHGLRLSWERIAALGACAYPYRGNETDIERTLLRFASLPYVEASRSQYLQGFEAHLAYYSPPPKTF